MLNQQGTEPPAAENQRPTNPALLPVRENPKLPRVLLIGDSISMGYTLPVRKLLQDKANVQHPPTNCGETARGLKQLAEWLGDRKWDVIHFNFGLHDIKYLDAAGKYVTSDKGKQVASLAEYESNLLELTRRLKKTGSALVWASMTPIPEGSAGRVAKDELRYNAVAARIMQENRVAVNDLHTIAAARLAEIQLPHNVHFTPDGYQILASATAASIQKHLP